MTYNNALCIAKGRWIVFFCICGAYSEQYFWGNNQKMCINVRFGNNFLCTMILTRAIRNKVGNIYDL